jgi:hypothetical protein
MATKIIYVSPAHHGQGPDLDILSPKALNALLEEGWDVSLTEKCKVPHPDTRKAVMVERYTLTTKNRGLTVAKKDPEREERRLARRQEREARSLDRGLSTLPQQTDNGSFLGGGSAFRDLPGVSVINGSTPDKAFMMGVDDAYMGKPVDSNPFPPGMILHDKWRLGWEKGATAQGGGGPGTDAAPDGDAYHLGKQAAKGPKDLEVSCPYPHGTSAFSRWLQGFKDGGGEVEDG